MEKKIKLSDYQELQTFSECVLSLNLALGRLNHHVEVLKRTGDRYAIDALVVHLHSFVDREISIYTESLKCNTDNKDE